MNFLRFMTCGAVMTLLSLCATMAEAATPYTFTAATYASVSNEVGCSGCFSAGMTVSGSFTMAAPLAPNLNGVVVSPTGYAFNDGLTAYADSDSQSYARFVVSTDAAGRINPATTIISIVRWKTALHTPGPRRVDFIEFSASRARAQNSGSCGAVDGGGACDTPTITTGSAARTPVGVWTDPNSSPAAVPTLSGSAMVLVTILLASLGLAFGSRLNPPKRPEAI